MRIRSKWPTTEGLRSVDHLELLVEVLAVHCFYTACRFDCLVILLFGVVKTHIANEVHRTDDIIGLKPVDQKRV